jgi:hypothetical protein
MTPVEPTYLPDGATRVIFAKDQPEYRNLPATVSPDGIVVTEWEPTADELDALLSGGRVRILLHTFNHPLQPLRVEIAEPECGLRES